MRSLSLSRSRADPAIARAVPFVLFIGLLMLGSNLAPEGGAHDMGMSAGWVVAGRGVIVALALAWFWPRYTELAAPGGVAARSWLQATIIGLALFPLWVYFSQDWAVVGTRSGFSPLLPDGSLSWPVALVRLAGIALVVPVMEELFWRSLVLRWIEDRDFQHVSPRAVGAKSFIIVTVLFALEHDHWVGGALAGAAYNWLYMRAGNLWVPILAHVLTNAALGVWVLYSHQWQFW